MRVVVAERAHCGRALRQRCERAIAARIIVGVGRGRTGGQRLRGAIADTVIGPYQRAPDADALLQAIRGGVGIGLAARRGEAVGDAGDVDAVAGGLAAVWQKNSTSDLVVPAVSIS